MMRRMKEEIILLLEHVLRETGITDVPSLVTRPEDPGHGNYATNVAMIIAKKLKKPPMEIAKEIQEAIIKHQKASTNLLFEKIEIAPPGFINFFLSEASLINQLGQVLNEGERFGTSPAAGVRHKKSEEKPQKHSDRKARLSTSTADKTVASKKEVVTRQKIGENFRTNAAPGVYAEKSFGGAQDGKSRIMIEFADPNPFKEFHIGHLRNITLGESFSRLLEATSHEVQRINYQGDIGMHVAKALWGLLHIPDESYLSYKTHKTSKEKAEFLGKAYAAGAQAFEEDDHAKEEIVEINKKVYRQDPSIVDLWKEGRQWSLDYFDSIYKRVGTHFTRFYFESEVAPMGVALVADHIKDAVFEESEGAVVFRGEKVGLHTRVFITKEGYATYEAKDLALAPLKYSEYPYDLSIIMTGNEQSAYFRVMLAALQQIRPDLAEKTRHIPFGMVNLKEGKMSSRTGNVITADWLIDQAKNRIYHILEKNESKYSKAQQEEIAEKAALAAVKYSMLKVTASSDIAFDLEKSVSFEGDSGPYLQYTFARAKSVLRKSHIRPMRPISLIRLNQEERGLAAALNYFPEVVTEAAQHFAPNTLCTYLFGLGQAFNLLYAKHEILGNDLRLALTAATATVLKNGLFLLGIATLEQM